MEEETGSGGVFFLRVGVIDFFAAVRRVVSFPEFGWRLRGVAGSLEKDILEKQAEKTEDWMEKRVEFSEREDSREH